MSLSSIVNEVPNYFIVILLNSELLFDYYREFINVTVNIQINDIRQLPIIIPNKNELLKCKILFDEIIDLKKQEFLKSHFNDNIKNEIAAKELILNNIVNTLYQMI
ncbi:hypothetical protein HMPREF2660_06840 [Weeksella sp. HMSC059D05]|nr:hypothetical protein HMPREF2660_06840 [Weeksella sp. HMSC059D05]